MLINSADLHNLRRNRNHAQGNHQSQDTVLVHVYRCFRLLLICYCRPTWSPYIAKLIVIWHVSHIWLNVDSFALFIPFLLLYQMVSVLLYCWCDPFKVRLIYEYSIFAISYNSLAVLIFKVKMVMLPLLSVYVFIIYFVSLAVIEWIHGLYYSTIERINCLP